ncbi:ABC transporter permease subunit, partial [Pantoea sp. SIMBA_079]|uniref:ABC transporter permease subunit n=1 Tax=Pantoea sp. SIMBA_079 TaxID=3085817 RepID=UPI0039938516
VPLGILSVVRQNRWYGSLISVVSRLGIAVPVFWIGILLVWIFAVKLRLFPSGGFPSRGWQSAPAAFQSLVLPVATIAIVMSAS